MLLTPFAVLLLSINSPLLLFASELFFSSFMVGSWPVMATSAFLKRSTLPKYNEDSNPGTAETEGLVGPGLYHFSAPPPPLFALKRKIINLNFFSSIFLYILCIFFNFKRLAFSIFNAKKLFSILSPLTFHLSPDVKRTAKWPNVCLPFHRSRTLRDPCSVYLGHGVGVMCTLFAVLLTLYR